jgi:hypothetical protein
MVFTDNRLRPAMQKILRSSGAANSWSHLQHLDMLRFHHSTRSCSAVLCMPWLKCPLFAFFYSFDVQQLLHVPIFDRTTAVLCRDSAG